MSYLIASYPRSGSTWLRFILCNLLYPEIEHDFDSINKHIPAIDNSGDIKLAIPCPEFYKTHGLKYAQNIIHLHRHVGDVLISEWWYKKKFHGENRELHEFITDDDYGRSWRDNINHYFPCAKSISYDELGSISSMYNLMAGILNVSNAETAIANALEKSQFSIIQKAEEKGFGIYSSGNTDIKFIREGTSKQWQCLDNSIQEKIIEKNYTQLKILGYVA